MNIFDWIPKPGQTKEIPGGVIFCKEWEATRSIDGMVNGTVTFEFWVNGREYKGATIETPKLGDSTKCLP